MAVEQVVVGVAEGAHPSALDGGCSRRRGAAWRLPAASAQWKAYVRTALSVNPELQADAAWAGHD